MRIKSIASFFLFPTLALLFLSVVTMTGLQGCQTSPDQTSQDPSTLTAGSELALAVVTTDSCAALKTALTGGTAADSAAFAKNCIVQVLPDSARPGSEPDSGLRCLWMKQHIDSGEVAIVAAFVLDNKTTCDSLKTSDSTAFAKYCRIPPPPPRPRCDSLSDTLAAMDSVSQNYLKLRLEVGALCALPLPPPPQPKQPPHPTAPKAPAAH
jgi:hypothetical protein